MSYRQQRASACHSKETERKVPISEYYQKERKTERKEAIGEGNVWILFVVFVFSLSACSMTSIKYRNTGYEQYRHAQLSSMGSTSSIKRAEKLVYQNINNTSTTKILSISKYQ